MLLLREEMRRVLTYLSHKAGWWVKQGTERVVSDPVLALGLQAYTTKKASLCRQLANDFSCLWLSGISDVGLPPPKTWPTEFLAAQSNEKLVRRRKSRSKLCTRAAESSNIVLEANASDSEDEDDEDEEQYEDMAYDFNNIMF